MSKLERWLTSIAIISSLLPLILMAFMIKLIPLNIQQFPLAVEDEGNNRYSYLINGLFCIVPLGIVLIARYIKHKMAVYDNYIAILCVSILLSVSFSVISLYGTFTALEGYYLLSSFDFLGFGVTVASIAIALCGNLTRYKTLKSKMAIKNRFTKSSAKIFKIVHQTASSVQIFLFVCVAVAASLIAGIYSIIVFAAAVIFFAIWCTVFSYIVADLYEKRRKTLEDEMRKYENEDADKN